MKDVRNIFLLCISCICLLKVSAQGYNTENTALANFIIRMYDNAPFEGVKIVSDYDTDYLLSVVTVKNTGSESAMNRVAQVKCQRQVSQFLNGIVKVSSETIIKTSEDVKTGRNIEEITDIIRENSVGFTRAMQVLTVQDTPSGEKCYMFFRKIEEMKD